jgi:hypothetical protein
MIEIMVIVILSLLLVAAIAAGIWATSRLSNLVYDLEEQVEESLDIIDTSYREIGKVLDTPVFYDDPVVKQTLTSLKKAHSGLLLIANKISEFSGSKKEKEE